MKTKGYNPLNGGYTGGSPSEDSNATSDAPSTITNIQSGVIPSQNRMKSDISFHEGVLIRIEIDEISRKGK